MPPLAVFVIANVLVIFAFVDTAYVAHLFQRGNLKKMWPVKILRFLVAGAGFLSGSMIASLTPMLFNMPGLVTTFFTSIFGWLLLPNSCEEAGLELSAFINGIFGNVSRPPIDIA